MQTSVACVNSLQHFKHGIKSKTDLEFSYSVSALDILLLLLRSHIALTLLYINKDWLVK